MFFGASVFFSPSDLNGPLLEPGHEPPRSCVDEWLCRAKLEHVRTVAADDWQLLATSFEFLASRWKGCNDSQAWPPKSLPSLSFYCPNRSFDSISVSHCPVVRGDSDPQPRLDPTATKSGIKSDCSPTCTGFTVFKCVQATAPSALVKFQRLSGRWVASIQNRLLNPLINTLKYLSTNIFTQYHSVAFCWLDYRTCHVNMRPQATKHLKGSKRRSQRLFTLGPVEIEWSSTVRALFLAGQGIKRISEIAVVQLRPSLDAKSLVAILSKQFQFFACGLCKWLDEC